jgi:hypothetical protein
MKTKATASLTQAQAAHLLNRIAEAHSAVRYGREPTRPAAVERARQVVDEWERRSCRAKKESSTEALRRANIAKQAVLFNTAESALKAVSDYESWARTLSDDITA